MTTTIPRATRRDANAALLSLRGFIGRSQLAAIASTFNGEERQCFFDLLVALEAQIHAMPKTYEQDGKGDEAVAHLHYFVGGCDWWITEKDRGDPMDTTEGQQSQAFGLADLGGGPELGYIGLPEILRCGAELDLYWRPKTLAEIKATR